MFNLHFIYLKEFILVTLKTFFKITYKVSFLKIIQFKVGREIFRVILTETFWRTSQLDSKCSLLQIKVGFIVCV